MTSATSLFIGNVAKDNDGGALYAEDDVKISYANLFLNTAYEDGGAIFCKNAFLDNCVCEDNSASGATFSQCEGIADNASPSSADDELESIEIALDISVEFIVNEAHVGQMGAVYYRDESSGIEKSFWTQEDIRGSIGFRNSNLTYWGGYVSFK